MVEAVISSSHHPQLVPHFESCQPCPYLFAGVTPPNDSNLDLGLSDTVCTVSSPCYLFSPATDHIDTSALSRRRIKLGFTPDVLTFAGEWIFNVQGSSTLTFYEVADLTVLLCLMATRNAGEALTLVKDGQVF